MAVRFGNVLGSAGSVMPIFQSQLENGEPLTITHPDMTRYFMTIQEAGWLILDAGSIGRPGDLFVLDMGEPVRIVDMARDLIRLSGHEDRDVPIRFTGLRPGEKLHERLFYETEHVEQTEVDKLLRVAEALPPRDVVARARRLLELALGDRDEELRAALFELVSQWPVPGADVAPAARPAAPSPTTPATVPASVPATADSDDPHELPVLAASDGHRNGNGNGRSNGKGQATGNGHVDDEAHRAADPVPVMADDQDDGDSSEGDILTLAR